MIYTGLELVVEVASFMRLCGHLPYADGKRNDHLRCKFCDFNIDTFGGGYGLLESISQLTDRCPGELYRPIPGTPWFDYSQGTR